MTSFDHRPHNDMVVNINALAKKLEFPTNKMNIPVGTTGGVITEVITPTLVEMSLIRGIN